MTREEWLGSDWTEGLVCVLDNEVEALQDAWGNGDYRDPLQNAKLVGRVGAMKDLLDAIQEGE